MFVWTSGFQKLLALTDFNMFVDEWTSANESLAWGYWPGSDYNENWGQVENFKRFRNQDHLRNSSVFNQTSKYYRMQTDRWPTVQGQGAWEDAVQRGPSWTSLYMSKVGGSLNGKVTRDPPSLHFEQTDWQTQLKTSPSRNLFDKR